MNEKNQDLQQKFTLFFRKKFKNTSKKVLGFIQEFKIFQENQKISYFFYDANIFFRKLKNLIFFYYVKILYDFFYLNNFLFKLSFNNL